MAITVRHLGLVEQGSCTEQRFVSCGTSEPKFGQTNNRDRLSEQIGRSVGLRSAMDLKVRVLLRCTLTMNSYGELLR